MKKPPKTSAERNREFRDRQRRMGVAPSKGPNSKPGKPSRKSGSSGTTKYQSRFERRQFIAIDGEGENYGKRETFTTGTISRGGKDGKIYHAQDHKYTLLAASNGAELYDGGRRLSAGACFDFLLDQAQRHKKAIFVIFSGSYDVNHILMHDIDRDSLLRISRGEIVDVELETKTGSKKYRIEYRARKSLSIKTGLRFYEKKDGSIGCKYDRTIRIWDVFGFFQENFVAVMRKWLGENHPDYALIKRMKALRGNFNEVSDHEIQEYNRAELRCLVELMEKVAVAIAGLGLVCSRWDGAGAVAGAIFKKQGIKQYKRITDDALSLAVRTAYSGGRIEACKIGNTSKRVYHYDVNSAYPSVMRNLPCLACGIWQSVKKDYITDGEFALYHLQYEFPDELPFYPLFFRNEQCAIMYPAQGEGWYWNPEAFAAQEFAAKMGGVIKIVKCWQYKTDCDHQPFSWIPEYYDTRQQWIQQPLEDWHNGGEKIIKLGLNSLYGKTAQQLGGTSDAPPAYFQMEWAGYITAGTRAALLLAALQSPYDIISFATDGLFSLASLDLYQPQRKELGAWEAKTHDGMTIVMPGVYWLKDGDKIEHFSRGFDKEEMRLPDKIIAAWAAGETSIPMPTHRLIGLGTACASDTFWAMRGRFVEAERILRLDYFNSQKRQIIDVKKTKPHKQLVDTLPRYNYLESISRPYPLKWVEDPDSDYEAEKEEDKEFVDSMNV